MSRPQAGEYAPYFNRYIQLVEEDDCVKALDASVASLNSFLGAIPEGKADYAYADGKWTVKQLLQHVIDAERIFAYRALSLSRGEQNPLPGFDENEYGNHATARDRSLSSLVSEFRNLRRSTIDLFASFNEQQLNELGVASNHPTKTNSLGFIILGHWRHHERILKERYLNM
jgi:uncharacterized damage-inducible protein DinB